MSPELIDILVCPRSKKKLVLADTATLDRVNALIAAGKCREISGTAVSEPLAEGLLQRETGVFYPVRDGIPVLIYDNAVELK
ncbi:MAG: Trm112 family protein [Turneriella sp.]